MLLGIEEGGRGIPAHSSPSHPPGKSAPMALSWFQSNNALTYSRWTNLALLTILQTCQLSKVVIKTHSPSLVHTLTQTLPHFKAANYQYVPADIATGLQQLDSQMMKLEDVGIRILFWEVGVDQTPDADFGAEYAIDQVDQDPGTPTSQWW